MGNFLYRAGVLVAPRPFLFYAFLIKEIRYNQSNVLQF
ncbi:hypothetical protein U471_20410 [Bacillus amyloliquefaciens CC178]|nr:hypothetical protein U471_20410 [Bacillus amyloliquefaciens CC178]